MKTIDTTITSTIIESEQRTMRARWVPDLQQDLYSFVEIFKKRKKTDSWRIKRIKRRPKGKGKNQMKPIDKEIILKKTRSIGISLLEQLKRIL